MRVWGGVGSSGNIMPRRSEKGHCPHKEGMLLVKVLYALLESVLVERFNFPQFGGAVPLLGRLSTSFSWRHPCLPRPLGGSQK